ncbi:MAG: rRNA pseudouridine synthase [Erysipelotrichaceae bacterium]|nr:rRNA pseudouridine synthase [Erysipelotrichaceae bacterium]
MRIDKLLAHAGYGTRNDVKKLLKSGVVTLNGQIIKSAKQQVDENKDLIKVDQEEVVFTQNVYYMLNKPQGYVSATTDLLHPVVTDLIDDVHELFPVGRLDIDTEGLLLLTNDGQFAHHLTSPRHHIDKIYEAIIDQEIDDSDINAFKEGIELEDFTCQSADLKVIDADKNLVQVTIQEGKYHQVKRMFQSRGKEVLYLRRIQIGPLKLDSNLASGEYRLLTSTEINGLSK